MQVWLGHKLSDWLSQKLKTEASIGTIKVGYMMDVTLQDVFMADDKGDTLGCFRKLHLVPSRLSPNAKRIKIASLELDSASFFLFKHKGERTFNYDFIIRAFSSGKSVSDTSARFVFAPDGWRVRVDQIKITNSNFKYFDQNTPVKPKGMDYDCIEVRKINLNATSLVMYSDTIEANISALSARERSGLVVDHLQGNIAVSSLGARISELRLKTPKSDIDCDFTLSYSGWSDYIDFIQKVHTDGYARWSTINLEEQSPFSDALEGMDLELSFAGAVSGTVDNLKGDPFSVTFGEASRLDGAISMMGLPNIEETFIRLKFNEFVTSADDIKQINLGQWGYLGSMVDIPEAVDRLGYISINGNFTGFWYDFVADATFTTRYGSMVTDMLLRQDQAHKFAYGGHLSTWALDLGKILDNSLLGPVTLSADLEGYGVSLSDALVDLKSQIKEIEVSGYSYKNIDITGQLSKGRAGGILGIDDPNLKLAFNGSVNLSETIPEYNFFLSVKDAYLDKLKLTERDDSTMNVSFMLYSDVKASSLDDLSGSIEVDSLKYKEKGSIYLLKDLHLVTAFDSITGRNLKIRSDFVDADVKGVFSFNKIGASFLSFANNYLANLRNQGIDTSQLSVPQNIDFSIKLKNLDAITTLFSPSVKIAHNSLVEGNFNSEKGQFFLQTNSPGISLGSVRFEDWYLKGLSQLDRVVLVTGARRTIFLEDKKDSTLLGLDSLNFVANIANDSVWFSTGWNDFSNLNESTGSLAGFVSFAKFPSILGTITESKIHLAKTDWSFLPLNEVLYDSTGIHFSNFGASAPGQAFKVDGVLSEDSTKMLSFYFSQFDLANFNELLEEYEMTLKGKLDGQADLTGLFGNLMMTAHLDIPSLVVNNEQLGDLKLISNYSADTRAIDLDASSRLKGEGYDYQPITIKGRYFPFEEKRNFDILATVNNVSLRILTPFLKDYLSDINGFVSSRINIEGSNDKPELSGTVKFLRSEFRVKYLNTRYSFADEIKVYPDKIVIPGLTLNDTLGRRAILSGSISHKSFQDLYFDLSLMQDRFTVLSTEPHHNRLFYGDLIVSGDMKLKGPLSNMQVQSKTSLEKGTNINVPMSSSVSVADNDFIIFLNQNSKEESLLPAKGYSVGLNGFNVNVDLTFKPDALVNIDLPYQTGSIESKGAGNVNFTINSHGDMGVTGDYEISNGTFLFKFRNLFTRQLEIRKGSRIRFVGDPLSSEIDLRAVYHNRTTLNGLGLSLDSTILQTRIPVNSVISLSNRLIDPKIAFSIEFPKLDNDIKQMIFSKLDTLNEVVMTQQILSLLVLNSFSFDLGNSSLASSISVSSFELLSNQVNKLISQLTPGFGIGVNYRPSDDVSAQELELALNAQLFDDRLTIDGNLGVRNNQDQKNQSQLVGDVMLMWKLKKEGNFYARAFNRSNNLDLLYNSSQYTQGIGLSYRKEFNHWKEFFLKPKSIVLLPDSLIKPDR